MEDKIKSKSIENGDELDFYEKINDKFPLENETDIGSDISMNLQELSKFDVPDLTNMVILNSKDTPEQKIKKSFEETIKNITSFKQELLEFICEEGEEKNYDVKIKPLEYILIYGDSFDRKTVRKINKLSREWVIKSAIGWNEHNLMVKIKMR